MRFRVVLPLLAFVVSVIGLAGWLEGRGEAAIPVARSDASAETAGDAIRRAVRRLPPSAPEARAARVARTVDGASNDPQPADVTAAASAEASPPVWGSGNELIDTSWDASAQDRVRLAALAGVHGAEPLSDPWVVRWALVTAGEPVVESEEVATVAERAYADPRGWSLNGAIRFDRIADPDAADFVLVVAEAAVIPEYSEDCVSWQSGEPEASCTVGSAVIINDHRWRDGALGDAIALGEFRSHEINHETGHWLGQGHFSCLGGAAAVNQQQFRSLAGCTANAWPLPWERAMVALRFGLWPGAGAYEPYDEIVPPEEVFSGGSVDIPQPEPVVEQPDETLLTEEEGADADAPPPEETDDTSAGDEEVTDPTDG